jgi:hypothetical protein
MFRWMALHSVGVFRYLLGESLIIDTDNRQLLDITVVSDQRMHEGKKSTPNANTTTKNLQYYSASDLSTTRQTSPNLLPILLLLWSLPVLLWQRNLLARDRQPPQIVSNISRSSLQLAS